MDDATAHKRLDELEARIHQLEQQAEDRKRGGPDQKFFETGSIHPEFEDRAIAP